MDITDFITLTGDVIRIGTDDCHIELNIASNNINIVGANLETKGNVTENMGKVTIKTDHLYTGDVEDIGNSTKIELHDPAHTITTNPEL